MKYRYLYQTKENRTVEGCVEAANRAEAYAVIRKSGVRPLRVIGDDPKPRKAWKRWFAIAVLTLALTVALSVIVRDKSASGDDVSSRQQILGDKDIIEVNARSGWARCFATAGERMLAAYAQPGWEVGTNLVVDAKELVASLDNEVAVLPEDPFEFRQVKQIVSNMKVELRNYLKDGGTAEGYATRLRERQLAEIAYYERAAQGFAFAEKKLGDDELYAMWLKLNVGLREMGVRTLPMPERLAKWPK